MLSACTSKPTKTETTQEIYGSHTIGHETLKLYECVHECLWFGHVYRRVNSDTVIPVGAAHAAGLLYEDVDDGI